MEESYNEEKEYSAYNIRESAIAEVQDLQTKLQITAMRIMHSSQLISMKGCEKFTKLIDLNLSSNGIERIECLHTLTELRSLNLSCNKIKSVQGLVTLFKLEKLNLSHNKIIMLNGLQQMGGPDYNLKSLDLRNNKVIDLSELATIGQLAGLEELYLDIGNSTNPCCANKALYYQYLLTLPNFKAMRKIDCKTPESIIQNLENDYDIKQQGPLADLSQAQQQPKKFSQQQATQKYDPMKENNINQGNKQAMYDNTIPSNQQEEEAWQGRGQDESQRIISLKQKITQLVGEQKELVYKFECNEKFWSNKCDQITEELNNQVAENRDRNNKVKQLQKENAYLTEQLNELRSDRTRIQNKNEKKEEIVDQLQRRITELIRENGEYHRELVIRNDEIQKLLNEQKEYQRIITELRGQLKENEKMLNEFHSRALDTANTNLMRNEDMRKKYDTTMEENKQLLSEQGQLKARVAELLELCREWEFKYEKKVDEMTYRAEGEKKLAVDEVLKTERETQKRLEELLRTRESEFKENMDLLESEFKKVLLENNDKYRQLKVAFDEKSRTEADAKQLMKISVAKNNEYEQIIQEMSTNLMKLKRDVSEIIQDKEAQQKEWETKRNSQSKEIAVLSEERDQFLHEKMQLERQLADQQEQQLAEHLELERMKAKMRNVEQMEHELDELQNTLSIKNKMLDDKNETIEDLKAQIDNMKKQDGAMTDDFQRLTKKYDKQSKIIDELETQLNQTSDDYNATMQELKEKKELISLFEREIKDIKAKQDKEFADLKRETVDKEQKIGELLTLLDECKETLKKKDAIIIEKDNLTRQKDLEIGDKEREFTLLNRKKDRQLEDLQKQNQDIQNDMVMLLAEIDKQKKEAKENIEKLTKLFSK